VLFSAVLSRGQTRSFTGRRLELTLGAPHNLEATLNGRPVPRMPDRTSTGLLVGGRLEFTPL